MLRERDAATADASTGSRGLIAVVTGAAALLVPGEGRGRVTKPPRLTNFHECWGITGFTGSYVSERYALALPSRVRRLVLDSVVPHDGSVQLLAPSMRRTAAVLHLACRIGVSATRPKTSPRSCAGVTTAPRCSTR